MILTMKDNFGLKFRKEKYLILGKWCSGEGFLKDIYKGKRPLLKYPSWQCTLFVS